MPQKRSRASGGKADAMTGDISARRGALPIKSTPPDHSEMVNGFEFFKGSLAIQMPLAVVNEEAPALGESTGANRRDQERPPAL